MLNMDTKIIFKIITLESKMIVTGFYFISSIKAAQAEVKKKNAANVYC